MVNEIVKMRTYFFDFLKFECESAQLSGWIFHIVILLCKIHRNFNFEEKVLC